MSVSRFWHLFIGQGPLRSKFNLLDTGQPSHGRSVMTIHCLGKCRPGRSSAKHDISRVQLYKSVHVHVRCVQLLYFQEQERVRIAGPVACEI